MTTLSIAQARHEAGFPRLCACGRGCSLAGMRADARWASRACAVRWGRENPGRTLTDAYKPNRTRTRTRRRSSGLQVSFWKAQQALEGWLVIYTDAPAPRNLAVAILEDALSDRQLGELHARKRAKRAPTLSIAEQREAFERLERAA